MSGVPTQVKLLTAPAIAHHFPRIARPLGLVNDEAAGGPELGGLFKFVRPAAVISHGIAAECFGVELRGVGRIGHRRIVHEHDDHFAADVGTLEIVPLIFRSLHPVAHENHVGIHRTVFHNALGPGDKIVLEFWRHGVSVPGKRELHILIRRNPY